MESNEVSSSTIELCRVDDVAPNTSKRIVAEGNSYLVVHLENDWYVLDEKCTHQDVSLVDGYLDADSVSIECAKHGSCFSLKTGEPDALPATKPVKTYTVHLDGDKVMVVTS